MPSMENHILTTVIRQQTTRCLRDRNAHFVVIHVLCLNITKLFLGMKHKDKINGCLFLFTCFILLTLSSGQTCKLKGDSPFAVLSQPFRWECRASNFPSAIEGIAFRQNGKTICKVPMTSFPVNCSKELSDNSRLVCGCLNYNVSRLYLNISRSILKDVGNWTCGFLNYNMHSLPVMHHVYYGPGSSISFSIPKTNISVKEGSDIEVSCRATCLPLCQYEWYKDSKLLVNSSLLKLKNLQDQDSGTYTCQVKNIVSKNTSQIQIRVLDEPKPPRNLKHVFSTSDTVCVAWRTGDDGGASHVFHIQIVKSTHNPSLILDWQDTGGGIDEPVYGGPVASCIVDLEPSTSYYVRVYASNEHHIGNASSPIDASTTDVKSVSSLSFGGGIGVGLVVGIILMIGGLITGVCVINKKNSQKHYPLYIDNTDLTSLVRS